MDASPFETYRHTYGRMDMPTHTSCLVAAKKNFPQKYIEGFANVWARPMLGPFFSFKVFNINRTDLYTVKRGYLDHMGLLGSSVIFKSNT